MHDNCTIYLFCLMSNSLVLLISDAKIAFDAFRNGMAATVFSKTVITVNPGGKAPHIKPKHLMSTHQIQGRCVRIVHCDKSISSILMFANASVAALTDTKEASQLFSYVKQAVESGALDLDERAEDLTGGCHDKFKCSDVVTCEMSCYLSLHFSQSVSLFPLFFKIAI